MGRERQAAEQGGRHAGRWRWGTARPRVPPDAHREARLATRQLPPMGSWPGDLAHCGVGRASRDSAGFGAMEEGLISRGGRTK